MQEKEVLDKVRKYCNERNIVYLSKKPKTYFEYYILAKTNRVFHLIKSPTSRDIFIWAETPNNDLIDVGYRLFYEGYNRKLKKYKDLIYYYFEL